MKTMLKVLGWIVFLVVAVVVAGVAVLKSMDFNQYRGLIAEQARDATGRELTIAGDLDLEISLNPSLVVEGVSFANAEWGSRPEMVKLERLEAQVELLPLLSGDVRIKRLVLVGLDVLAEIDSQGRANWDFGGVLAAKAGKPADSGEPGLLPVVHMVRLENVKVIYKDSRTGGAIVAVIDGMDVESDGAGSPLKVGIKGSYNGAPYDVKARLGSLDTLLGGGKPFAVSLEAGIHGATLAVEGTIELPRQAKGIDLVVSLEGAEVTRTVIAALEPALKNTPLPPIGPFSITARLRGSPDKMSVSEIRISGGRKDQVLVTVEGAVEDAIKGKGLNLAFTVVGADLAPFSKLAKGRLPELPPFKVAGRITDPAGGYVIDGLKLDIGGSDLSGKVAVKLSGERPEVDAQLASNLLDLDKLLPAGKAPGEAKAETGKGDGRVFPDDPLPLDGLEAVDARLEFRGKRILAKGFVIEDAAVELTLNGGRLEIMQLEALFGGGRITGEVVIDGAKSVPALALKLDVKQLDFGNLLKQLAVTDIASGKLDLNIDVRGAGNSVRAIMAGLDGRTRLVTEGGKIESGLLNVLSTDIFSMFSSSGDKNIRCGVVHFDIDNGQAVAKTILFETGGLSVVGTGGVNLADETLALEFDPRAKKASLLKAAIPFKVGGTMASPSVVPDVAAAAVGVVTGVVSTATGLASGGLQALGGLVGAGSGGGDSGGVDETDYCKLALAGKPLVPSAPRKAATTTQSAPTPVEKPVEKEKEGITGIITEGLKGLFGN